MTNSTRIWKWMVGLLTLLNIALLITTLQKPKQQPGPHLPEGGPGQRIIHDLNLNRSQETEFEKLKHEHHEAMLELQDKGRELRDEFFSLLKQDNPDQAMVNEKAKAIAKNQEEIEMVTFNHFQQVRKLCNSEQQKKFDSIINDVLHSMAGPPNRRHD